MGLWYRGSRVRVPLATLENKGFVSEGFVGPVGNPQMGQSSRTGKPWTKGVVNRILGRA